MPGSRSLAQSESKNGLADGVTAHQRQPDLTPLTGLRFIAAFAVVIYHFAAQLAQSGPRAVANLAASGFVAVDFFYILSGFILAYSYIRPSGELRGDRKSFYVARFARIYPAYALAFLLAAPHNVFASLHANSTNTGVARLLLSSLSYISLQQAWTPWTAWCWNYPAWSVSVETFFYLLFPFVAPMLVSRLTRKSCIQLCCLLWVASLAVPMLVLFVHGDPGVPLVGGELAKALEFTPILRLPEFLIGVLLGRAFSLGLFAGKPGPWAAPACGAGLLLILSFQSAIPHGLLANGFLLPLFAGLILSLASHRTWLSRLLSFAPLVLLGEASYGLYILQMPVSYVAGMTPPSTSILQFAIYFCLLIITSLLSWKFVEGPCRTYLRNALNRTGSNRPKMRSAPWASESRFEASMTGLK